MIKRFCAMFLSDEEDNNNRKYLMRCLAHHGTRMAHFYITAKLHKSPWNTRPIVSTTKSILYGLGRWLDTQLQLICDIIPFQARNSRNLVTELSNIPQLPTNALLFTCDAVSMYTNIDTSHALQVIGEMFAEDPMLCRRAKVNA
jgi:hypothetical protein